MAEDSFGSEHALGIEAPKGIFVALLGNVLAQQARQPAIAGRLIDGSRNRGGNEQIALDVTPAPGEELEARLGRFGRRLSNIVPIEDAEGTGAGARTTESAKVFDRPGGLTAAQNDRGPEEPTRQRRHHPVRPAPKDAPVPGSLQVQYEAPRAVGGGSGRVGMHHGSLQASRTSLFLVSESLRNQARRSWIRAGVEEPDLGSPATGSTSRT
jgi:hypothetical protein